MVDLRPTRGREQDGTRPALVLLVDKFNHGPADLVIVVPITKTQGSIPIESGVETNATTEEPNS